MRMTVDHTKRVAHLLADIQAELAHRAAEHDRSKFSEAEWPHFAEATHQLKGLTYGSPEYRAALDKLRPAIEHHNAHNPHHPEYHTRGIDGMTLIDLIEMLADWKAASERHADGDLRRSVSISQERFGISEQLAWILVNTAEAMNWLPSTKGTR